MKAEQLHVQTAAVLGAGVMGAQIAALFVSAGIKTYLFDLSTAIVTGSIKSLKQLKPAPLGVAQDADCIIPANYDDDVDKLAGCDFVIEAISERLEYKVSLYSKIAGHINKQALLATNTSGLSIETLAQALSPELQARFCGVHFFNPPRYMKLVEIIPSTKTDPLLLMGLESFLVTRLGKGVVYAKDTPNFIGNRIGVFAMLTCVHHAKQFNLTPDIIDGLMGPRIGRSKSAIFRTMDVVGLDTLRHVIVTLEKGLPDDPWHDYFCLPDWINGLIDRGALGQKTKAGIYKKENEHILVYQDHEGVYRPAKHKIEDSVAKILAIANPQERFVALRSSDSPQAQFLWACYRDLFHYAAYHLSAVASNPRDIDLALRWGYGWQEGPFETWQAANWHAIANWIEEDRKAGLTMSPAALPEWVFAREQGVYDSLGAYSPVNNKIEPRSSLPVYRRQLFPDRVLGDVLDAGDTLFETPDVRLWHTGDNVPILSFKSKKNTITTGVLEGIVEAIDLAERDYGSLLIWQNQGSDFSVGANLKMVLDLMTSSRFDALEALVKQFQDVCMRVKYSAVPVVTALQGLVFGGGCELALHARSRVASFETYMGLVEIGVGIIPAGGGCKELALKASQLSGITNHQNLFAYVAKYFQQIAMGEVSQSAVEAKIKQYLRPEDKIVMNNQELLYLAKKQAVSLADESYCPPLSRKFAVAGRSGIANLQTQLVNMREGNFISDHDYLIGTQLAQVLCGGDREANSLVDEQTILTLEREAFMRLAKTDKTQARIKHMLEKGKPLRN